MFNDHHKNSHNFESGHMMPQVTTAMIYDHNPRLNYSHKDCLYDIYVTNLCLVVATSNWRIILKVIHVTKYTVDPI